MMDIPTSQLLLVLIRHPVRHHGHALPCWFAVGVRAAMCGFNGSRAWLAALSAVSQFWFCLLV
ncbi:hypothetical protein J6590_080502 [Homalodisca vitripennis]|nr:hypothetical protein J6590_080502 [Homalodisca vitripennis]